MGAMHARKFAEEGAKVVVTDINEEAGKALVEEKFGPVTVLVNNAGVGIFKTLDQLTEADFRLTFEIDELGVFLGMKTVVSSMKKAGVGSIVNISSVDGLVSAPTAHRNTQ